MNPASRHEHWGNHLLAALPDATLTLLKRDLSSKRLAQGTICFHSGERVGRVYFPTSGLVSLLVSTGDGHLAEAGMIGSEGAAGLQSAIRSSPSFTRAIVQVPGEIWSLSAERLREAVQSSAEANALVSGYTEILWAETQQLAGCNAVHPALQRLARWLLQAADRTQSLQLPLTQEFLSQMLGVRRTTVTALVEQLQERGAVKTSRGNITILDRARLEATACQCYHIIRELYRKAPRTWAQRGGPDISDTERPVVG